MHSFLSLFGLSSSPSASAFDLSVFDPATPQAQHITELFWLLIVITGVIFVLVEGFLLYSLFRFRHGKHTRETPEPAQFYGSAPVEVAWTLAPFLTVFVVFLVISRTVSLLRHVPGASDQRIEVVGHQWWWEYRYYDPTGAAPRRIVATTANELHVPVGQPIVLELRSADVIHSFWIPRLNGKTDVIPGRTNLTAFRVPRPGTFLGQCSEYCGTQHANMLIRVVAESPRRFDSWLARQRRPASESAGTAAGQQLFMSLACSNCHTIRGSAAQGSNGPDLTHLMSRKTLVTGIVPNDREHLMQWLRHPQTIKPGSLMPDMHLSRVQAQRLTDYLLSLH